MPDTVWFWQRIVSPHMAGLAAAVAAIGREVVFVAEKAMSASREAQGWQVPDVGGASLCLAPTNEAMCNLARSAPSGSVHLCQGLRNNGAIGAAQVELANNHMRQWVLMETVDDGGWRGRLRRLEYGRLVSRRGSWFEGAFAIGHTTDRWLVDRGMVEQRVFPFAYFLPRHVAPTTVPARPEGPFRFLFVGQFIERKRIDLLLTALSGIQEHPFELVIAGSGQLETGLRELAGRELPERVAWAGRLPMSEVPALMSSADCLVLPSRHDGWGAVVSEALMAGTPAVCSSACGAAEVVRSSGLGGVFPNGSVEALRDILRKLILAGRSTPRERAALAEWAGCLSAAAGAKYLDAVLTFSASGGAKPAPPWESASGDGRSK